MISIGVYSVVFSCLCVHNSVRGKHFSLWQDAKARSFFHGPVRRQITKLLSVIKYDICTNSACVIFFFFSYENICDEIYASLWPECLPFLPLSHPFIMNHPSLSRPNVISSRFTSLRVALIFVKLSNRSSSFRNLGKLRHALINLVADLKR